MIETLFQEDNKGKLYIDFEFLINKVIDSLILHNSTEIRAFTNKDKILIGLLNLA